MVNKESKKKKIKSKAKQETILSVKNLQTHFETKWGVIKAVDGVSFDLKKGETLAVVGESGSGKSVTSLSIMQLVPSPPGHIVGGEINFESENLLEKSDREMQSIRGSKIAMVLQDPMTALNPVFKISDQVGETLSIHKKLKGEKLYNSIIEMLKKVNIPAAEERMKDYPHQLSGGMRQRVVGAIGVSCSPTILIADEPTTSLDATIQAQYLRLLKDLQDEFGMAILFITHDFGIVAKMCDRVAVMYAGRIVEIGEVREIFNNPRHPYTQGLIKSVPSMDEDIDRLYSIPGQPPALWDVPDGCRFSPRKETSCCDECENNKYEMVEVQDGHWVDGCKCCQNICTSQKSKK
jgi:oligopeptide/dipeptide ABC transporter ATP-binding protein